MAAKAVAASRCVCNYYDLSGTKRKKNMMPECCRQQLEEAAQYGESGKAYLSPR